MPGPAGAIWTVPDAALAAVLGVCLAAMSVLLAARFAGQARFATVVGPAVAGALVVAMVAVLLTRGDTVARAVVAAGVVLVALAAAAAVRLRPSITPPERERRASHNEIATPDRRC